MLGDDNFPAIAPSEPPKESLKLAVKEADTLEDGPKKVRDEVHRITILALRVGAFIIGSVIVVRVCHVVLPDYCRWLSEIDIQSIDKMLFSSAFGGLVLGYLKEIMQPLNKS